MAVKRREEIEASAGIDRLRQAKKGISSLSYTTLVVVAVVLVLVISMKLHHRFDVSRTGANVLSQQTLEVLDGLQEDVQVYPLFTVDHPNRQSYWYLLQLYREASSAVDVEFIDPVARPGAVKRLGLDPGQDSARGDGITVVVQGDQKRVFEGVAEEDVTNAILDVGTQTQRIVGFVRGYGELDPTSRQSAGLGLASLALGQEYYALADVELSEGIAPQISVLVLAAPRIAIPQEALDVLAAWLEDGGRLLVLTDPGRDVGLNSVLERWGLEARGILVAEPQRRRQVRRDRTYLKVIKFTQHEIVKGFGPSLPCGFPVAGVVTHFEPEDQLVFHEGLARSSDFSVALFPDGSREGGPFALAAASWRRDDTQPDKETRVVLVGDADFATNEYLHYGANKNFLLNCIGWLSREQSLVSIRRQELVEQTLDLSSRSPGLTLVVALMPALFAVAGVVMYLRRRKL